MDRANVRFLAAGLAMLVLAILISAGTALRTATTFDASAFEDPSFYARGAELGQLLKVADKAQRVGDRYESSVHRTISGYATLLKARVELAPVQAAQPAVLVSDPHGNELVLGALRPLFAGSPVFAGDFGRRGTPAEARVLVPQIVSLGPTGAPSGESQVLKVAGYSDPLEWRGADPNDPRRIFSFSERPDGDREYGRAVSRLVDWFESLRPRPDVVMVHQNGLAQRLARRAAEDRSGGRLLILTGHDHEQHIDRYGRVLVVDAGTVGAGGILGAGKQSVGVAQLHIPNGSSWPRAVDLVQVEPLSGAARADRILPRSSTACERDTVRCHGEGRSSKPAYGALGPR